MPDELVVVLFDGQLEPRALAAASSALESEPQLGAVLLAAGAGLGPPLEYDPVQVAERGAGVVLRRQAWLEIRGFASLRPPAGYEAWSFSVACAARGIRTARIAGALRGEQAGDDDADARGRVLAAHPALATRRAEQAERGAANAEARVLAAERERDRVVAQLEQLRATRSWRLVARWWRVRDRLR